MGNQLTGVAPAQILPVEQYLTDAPNFIFEENLGSTRFFKVAKARYNEGPVVVKVFVIHDPSLPLKAYKDQLDNILIELQDANNCLPFERATQSDRAALIFRQYVKDSLYDRISTRPFLNATEKKWVAFQLLCALNQCHQLNVCHGDIKSENVMVTSWNWVFLTDFASFKPTYLPEDNPADFSYFFDTSRRRTCCIAPERFVESSWRMVDLNKDASNLDLTASEVKKGDLTPSMDIFSAGCVIAELFTEGTSPFDLSQLLAYRAGEYSPNKLVQTIEDANVRDLVTHMIQRDPGSRWSAERYLLDQRGKAFPEYFYSFLRLYCQRFVTSPILYADERINRIKRDLDLILEHLKVKDVENNTSLVVIISLLTSSIRPTLLCETKLTALDLMMSISEHVSSEVILDRLVPYMLHLLTDGFSAVRCEAIRTLTKCLSQIRNVPVSDVNIFPEYILPHMNVLASDPVTMVRATYAENIAVLAENALRFLEIVQLNINSSNDHSTDTPPSNDLTQFKQSSYDLELQALHEMIQQKVAALLTDPDNIVKEALTQNGITRLCVFFGRQKANDVLLSHMITFLNDKNDWHLRASFFDNIVGVAAYVGWQSCTILKPLLQQGLTDCEEFIISKTLRALSSVVELGLLQKATIRELFHDVAPFLLHPNIWIRHGAVGFFSKVARKMDVADIHCHLLPQLMPFLKEPIVQIDEEVILLSSLKDAIARQLYDHIVRFVHLESLLDLLLNRQIIRHLSRHGQAPAYAEPDDYQVGQMLRKLISQGMTTDDEDKVVALMHFVLKQHRQRSQIMTLDDYVDRPGVVNLSFLQLQKVARQLNLNVFEASGSKVDALNKMRRERGKQSGLISDSPVQGMNEDWKQMFGSLPTLNTTSQLRNQPLKEKAPFTLERNENLSAFDDSSSSSSTVILSKSGTASLMIDRSRDESRKCCRAACKVNLQKLFQKKYKQFVKDRITSDLLDSNGCAWDSKPLPSGWVPKGLLVAHLHEHRGAVNRIRVSQDQTYFATCSNDGTVKVWDCRCLEGKSVTNRSRHTYNKQGGQIKTLCFCDSSQCLASASDSGAIHVFKTELGSNRVTIFNTMNLDVNSDGLIVDMTYFDTGSQNVIAYTTVHGLIVGCDIRSPRVAWKLENDPKLGLVTSFDIHHQLSWLVLGTSSGAHTCWDMRFQLPINTVQHPNGYRVRRILVNQSANSSIISSIQGNNEVDMWDMETNTRQKTLWVSSAPPLSQTQSSKHSINGMYLGHYDNKSAYLITAGTDMRIRFWDLRSLRESRIIVGAATDKPTIVSYESRLIEGTEVIYEAYNKVNTPSGEPHGGLDPPAPGHHDVITDINLCHLSQSFLITSSRDGMVKVWK